MTEHDDPDVGNAHDRSAVEPPADYVPLPMPELWEPGVDDAAVPQPPARSAQAPPPGPGPQEAVAPRKPAGSMGEGSAGLEWEDPDSVQVRMLPRIPGGTPTIPQQAAVPPEAAPMPAVPIPPQAAVPIPPQTTVPAPPQTTAPTLPVPMPQQAAVPMPAVSAPQHATGPVATPPTGPVGSPQTGPVGRQPRVDPGGQVRPQVPRSLSELRNGPFAGREFETAQALAVAAVLELGLGVNHVGRLFRVPAWRVDEWVRTALTAKPKPPRLGTAGRPYEGDERPRP